MATGDAQVIARAATNYSASADGYVEFWSPVIRPPGQRLLEALPWDRVSRILDVGTGTGALIPEMRRLAPTASVIGIDPSLGMLDRATGVRAPLVAMDAMALGARPGTFDIAVLVFVLFHVPDPPAALADRMVQYIMQGLVERDVAPHHAELARALELSVEAGRLRLLDVLHAYPIGWLHPETDYIASFPPLNNQPTQYRITVRGEPRWFSQCGFEATSVTWLFPGETVRVDAPCLDRGDPVAVEMRDGRITRVDPPGVVGHLNYGFGSSRGRPAFL